MPALVRPLGEEHIAHLERAVVRMREVLADLRGETARVRPGESTSRSRLRTLEKKVRWAERQLRAGEKRRRLLSDEAGKLLATERELSIVGARLAPVETDRPRLSHSAYSRAEIEHALERYVADADSLPSARRVVDLAELNPVEGDADDMVGEATGLAGPDWPEQDTTWFSVDPMPRTRNALGERLSAPARGRKNRHGRLPLEPRSFADRLPPRLDLQRAMRLLSPAKAELLFWRGVVGLTFGDVGRVRGTSTQAAHKGYGKALDEGGRCGGASTRACAWPA